MTRHERGPKGGGPPDKEAKMERKKVMKKSERKRQEGIRMKWGLHAVPKFVAYFLFYEIDGVLGVSGRFDELPFVESGFAERQFAEGRFAK